VRPCALPAKYQVLPQGFQVQRQRQSRSCTRGMPLRALRFRVTNFPSRPPSFLSNRKKTKKESKPFFSLEKKCDGATKTHPLPLSLVVCCCAWALATLGLIGITRGLVQLPLERTYVPVKVLLWNVAFRLFVLFQSFQSAW
jgi:hypothetical protein